MMTTSPLTSNLIVSSTSRYVSRTVRAQHRPILLLQAYFLFWHRYAIWTFEQDLRNLCGYTGTLPYWDWGSTAMDPVGAEIFNGDPYSMGSNGAYIPNNKPIVFTVPLPDSFLQSLPNPQTNISVPAGTGTGGGCINQNVRAFPLNIMGKSDIFQGSFWQATSSPWPDHPWRLRDADRVDRRIQVQSSLHQA